MLIFNFTIHECYDFFCENREIDNEISYSDLKISLK